MKGCAVKNKLSRAPGFSGRTGGFSLVELLIAMAVGLVVLGAMYSVFTIQNKTFANQENFVEMQQSVRAGMDMMTREIRMAGYDPTGAGFDGITYNADQLQIQADMYQTNDTGNPDGDTNDSNENIVYKYYDENSEYPYQIKRKTGAGYFQPFVENVQSFTFQYLYNTGIPPKVDRVRITITGRTAKPDPAYTSNSGYRTYTLTSVIAPRNLAY
jgi:type IV pilus assembly protein PilW